MNVMPETAYSEVPSSQSSAACGHGKNVDIVGVTGSIPVTPTIQIKHLAEKDVAPGRFDKPCCVHFVGFRGEEYWSAVKAFGRPDFIHRGWDLRARREIADGDFVVFATGPADQPPRVKSFDDIREPGPPSNPASMNH